MFQRQKIMGLTGKFKRGLTYVKPLLFWIEMGGSGRFLCKNNKYILISKNH